MLTFILIFSLVGLLGSSAQIIQVGQCNPDVAVVPNFDVNRYTGLWHDIESYPSTFQQGTCNNAFYTLTPEGTVDVFNTQVVNQRLDTIRGVATIPDPTQPAKLLVSFPIAETDQTTSTNYWVLATDYTSYSLVYTCNNLLNNQRAIYSWKLNRTKAPFSAAANAVMDAVISTIDALENQYFIVRDQSDAGCFYYPVFTETPESIILPGACPSISAKPNFEPERYLGTWHDVGSYPIPSQNGTCSSAVYTLVDDDITIRNTMVIDEELIEQNGVARLSSDGTGLLTITFTLENGAEVVTSYYVLETDYTSFSLVYNCRDLADGSRQVFSWKLSRTIALTQEANAIINNIIRNTQGLLAEYYLPSRQTAAGCFYVPVPEPGQPILFRGACSLPTLMPNFKVNEYLGWWHEIERYPTGDIAGDCTSTNFISSLNSVQVVDSSVQNGTLYETTGTAVLSISGIILIIKDGVETFWLVADTDYTSYSLVYSCETISTDWGPYSRVWSAKHTRLRSLSPADNAAIDVAIAANYYLRQEFYEPVNQSDAACFHYRDDVTDQVVLPGQCDTEIPVQAGFEVSRFAGTWYQIERYPYPEVSNEATCLGTQYTPNDDDADVLSVLNWEVLGGTLNTIEGTATVDAATATLNVNLPQEGGTGTRTMALRVLLTDYDNYALLYTCVNINLLQRSVGAFKLSRTRSLSNDAQYAIGNYMDPREEFHLPYFISVSQNEQCLEPESPEPDSALLVKSSIVVMIVCFALQLIT